MVKSRIIELMAKKIGQCASQDEMDELISLLSEYPDYAHLYEIVLALKGSKDHFEPDVPKDELINHGWQHLADKLNKETSFNDVPDGIGKKGLFRTMFASNVSRIAAAAVILLVGSGIVYHEIYASKNHSSSDKIENVHFGGTSKLTLADGSQVWLNAGSILLYPEKFSGTQREVTLEGEGFFEVTKNAQIPFLVHAGKITVKVLGTKFNVKAYREDPDIETTLISGKVQVMLNDDPEKEIILAPHEKLTVTNTQKTKDTITAKIQQVNNELKYQVQTLPAATNNSFAEIAWLNNKLVFSNESFDNVARMLERKYDVHFYFKNSRLKEEHVTGIFEKEDIRQTLDVLKMTTHFNYNIEGNDIRLF
jgi:transmembrane sensor